MFLLGCGTTPTNPSFPLTTPEADKQLRAMEAEPRRLDRPVVVIDGYLDPGFGSAIIADRVRRMTPDDGQVITVNLLSCSTFDACRKKIVDAVDAAFPTDDDGQTVEVDVIGVSMGGLAARYAAMPAETVPTLAPATQPASAPQDAPELPRPSGRRLRIARLFTLASPHLGATMADAPTYLFVETQRDMRIGSPFLTQLNDPSHPPEYPIIPYVRLADITVGEKNAAPPGQTPIWLNKGLLESAHAGVVNDPRIAADVCRRLRGEASFVTEPRAPLPD